MQYVVQMGTCDIMEYGEELHGHMTFGATYSDDTISCILQFHCAFNGMYTKAFGVHVSILWPGTQ